MKRKFQIEGIRCGGCVTRVKKALEEHPDISKTEVYLNPKGTTVISMKEELSVHDLQKQIDKLEGYTIIEIQRKVT